MFCQKRCLVTPILRDNDKAQAAREDEKTDDYSASRSGSLPNNFCSLGRFQISYFRINCRELSSSRFTAVGILFNNVCQHALYCSRSSTLCKEQWQGVSGKGWKKVSRLQWRTNGKKKQQKKSSFVTRWICTKHWNHGRCMELNCTKIWRKRVSIGGWFFLFYPLLLFKKKSFQILFPSSLNFSLLASFFALLTWLGLTSTFVKIFSPRNPLALIAPTRNTWNWPPRKLRGHVRSLEKREGPLRYIHRILLSRLLASFNGSFLSLHFTN